MNTNELNQLLEGLLNQGESHVVEFKEAKRQFSTDKLGKYISALANEANLRNTDAAWIVFGIDDQSSPAGTTYLYSKSERNEIEFKIQEGIDQNLTIRNSYEIQLEGKRILLLEIPPSPSGLPTSWKGFYYARSGESLVPLPDSKRDEIRNQTLDRDWTAQIVSDADLTDLSTEALAKARDGFKRRPGNRIPAEEIDSWDDWTFLAKAQLLRDGKLTRGTLLLLGNPEARFKLSPHMAEITWRLETEEQAYEHFHPPFLLTITEMAQRIRNINIRILPKGELIHKEVSKYDERSILEATYNCLVHQDYSRNARIVVTEYIDRVDFISVGDFYDGQPEEYVLNSRTPNNYRNPFLASAMTMLNLIDHMGYGIKRIYQEQAKRYFPLPDYDFSRPGEVRLSLPGAIIDEAYSQALIANTDLDLADVMALDRVQKGQPVDNATIRRLRRRKLIEGRKPHYRVNSDIASQTGRTIEYVRNRPQHDTHYQKLILDLLETSGSASRQDIDSLLHPLLRDTIEEHQIHGKISRLLTNLRKANKITNAGSRSNPRWELANAPYHNESSS